MKKFLIALIVFGANDFAFACDACGCSGSLGNMGLGVQVQGNRTSFSFLHSYKRYSTTYHGLYGNPDEFSTEYYLKSDLSASIRLSKRFQARVNIPFLNNFQTSRTLGNTRINGLGDLQGSLNYFIIDSSYKKSIVRWSTGVGIKTPTGKFVNPDNEKLMLYPGTGTFDYTVNSSFAFRQNSFGISNETVYFLRSANKHDYHPGNTFFNQTMGVFILRNLSFGTGISLATNGIAKLDGTDYEYTNTESVLAQSCSIISYSKNNLSLQLGFNIPFFQQLGEGQSKQNEAISFGIYYLLRKAK